MKQIPFFSNGPKFPADRLKLRAKVRKVKTSKKMFKLQIKEREQVSKNDKRFNVGKNEKEFFNVSNDFVRMLHLFRKMLNLNPNYPNLTLISGRARRLAKQFGVCTVLISGSSPSSFLCEIAHAQTRFARTIDQRANQS